MAETTETRSYSIQHPLGKGGFGTVYKAELIGPGGFAKAVALKILNDDMEGLEEVAKRMRDEARILGLIRHRAIVHVDGLVMLDGRWAVVMEYVEGVDLDAVLENYGKMPIGPVLEIIGELAGALHSAYDKPGPTGEPLRLLHRDIKPANIQLTAQGEVKVLDFGIARAEFQEREAKTQNMMFGSVNYMAPERMDLIEKHEGDVYSVGVVVFELLTCELFGKAQMSPKRHEKQLKANIEKLEGLQIPKDLIQLIVDCVAYEPEDRPTAKEIAKRCRGMVRKHSEIALVEWAEEHVPGMRPKETPTADGLSGRILRESTTGTIVPQTKPNPDEDLTGPRAIGGGGNDTMFVADLDDTGENPAVQQKAPPPPPPTASSITPSAPASPAAEAAPATPAPAAPAPTAPQPSAELESATQTAAVSTVGVAAAAAGGGALVAVGLVVILLLIGGGVGAYFFLDMGGDGTDTEQGPTADTDEPDTDKPEPKDTGKPADDTDPAPNGGKTPNSGGKPTDGGKTPSGDSTDATADAATDTDTDPAQDTDATDGGLSPEDGCGGQAVLEVTARDGKLSGAQSKCVDSFVKDTGKGLTERRKMGTLLLVNHQMKCQKSKDCKDYEAFQPYYFEEIDRSKADQMLAWAVHNWNKPNKSKANLQETARWAERALEQKGQWKSVDFVKNVEQAHELRARSTYEMWTRERKADPFAAEKWQGRAKTAALDWMNYRLQLGKDASEARKLCESVAGSAEVCSRGADDQAKKTVITFVSLPIGAKVLVDGKEVGKAPMTYELSRGGHEVKMIANDGKEGTQLIKVGSAEPVRYVWKSAADAWETAF